MTISEAISELENHSAVASAGAGPTDIGKIPCFQVVLDSANYLNDKTGSELENIVYEKTKDLFSTNGDIVVQYSGEYMEDTNDPVFWIFVYQNLGRISVGGVEYNIVEYNKSRVVGVSANYTDPISGFDIFKWSEINADLDDLAN